MKLVKYLFWTLLLIFSLIFLVELNELNLKEGDPMTIKLPYLVDEGYENGINVWLVLIMTLTGGVLVGFFIGMFQLITHKKETMSLRSKVRRLQVELDSLRNQAIDDDLILSDNAKDLNE